MFAFTRRRSRVWLAAGSDGRCEVFPWPVRLAWAVGYCFARELQRRLRAPHGPGTHQPPSCVYTGMLLPLTPSALLRGMFEDWRTAWGEGSLPLLFVQLANLNAHNRWPGLWEWQAETLAVRCGSGSTTWAVDWNRASWDLMAGGEDKP